MKSILFILVVCLSISATSQKIQIDPKRLNEGWHSDTTIVQVDYKNHTYDDSARIIVKYYMCPKRKPISSSLSIYNRQFKEIKLEDIADIKTN